MPTFRCYFLDGDGHIKSRTEIEVDGLPQAIEQALKLLKEQPEHRAVESLARCSTVVPGRAVRLMRPLPCTLHLSCYRTQANATWY